jgi:CO/xanthine dehydrogenase FAD-binding subunit
MDGERVIPVDQLYRDDGIDYLSKRRDELVTDIFLPAESDASHLRTSFWKLRRRGSIDFAVLSVAVALKIAPSGVVEDARIVLGAVSSTPVVATTAAKALIGKEPTDDVIAAAADLARKPATPLDNTDFQAQWRSAMVSRYTEAALREAAGLPVGNLSPRQPST